MTWHDLIREARERAALSQSELAEKVGCSQATINKIENDKPQSSKFLLEIINQLRLSVADFPPEAFGIDQRLSTGERMVKKPYQEKKLNPSVWAAELGLVSDIPIYASIEFVEEVYVIDSTMAGTLKRPPFLQGVVGAYALSTSDEAMSPEYEPGDILFANPRQIILPGTLCAFYGYDRNVEEMFVYLRRFVSHSEKNWRVLQHNPSKEIELEKSLWPVRHRIVGKIFR